jgi:hypothetical protein
MLTGRTTSDRNEVGGAVTPELLHATEHPLRPVLPTPVRLPKPPSAISPDSISDIHAPVLSPRGFVMTFGARSFLAKAQDFHTRRSNP